MNEEAKASPTKALFDSLRQLFRQTGQLLMDSDRVMGERGWEPTVSNVTAEYSMLPSLSDRWFPRWAFRFYAPSKPEDESHDMIDSLKLVSVHFTSDRDTEVDEPLLVAGYIKYRVPLKRKQALQGYQSYGYWLCKSWFYGSGEEALGTWRTYVPEKFYKDIIEAVTTFALPLYDITSSEILEQRVINRLFDNGPIHT